MWFFLSLYFALWTSISTLIVKRLTHSLHPATILLVGNLFTLPFTVGLLWVLGGIPRVSEKFFPLVLFSSVLDVVAFFASIYAVKISPISLVSPIASFNPVFTALIAMAVLGEIPTVTRFGGILFIVLGAYLLNISDVRNGFFAPLKTLISHRGVQLSFLAYFIWGITPLFQKQAIFATLPQQPLFASFVGSLLIMLLASPISVPKTLSQISTVRQNILLFLLPAPFTALAFFAAFTAFSLTNLGYATAIFKLSTLFTILLGALFFKEERFKERLLGGSVMIAGTLLLVL